MRVRLVVRLNLNNHQTRTHEKSSSDENGRLRFPAIRFRFSPSRIEGGNFKSFRQLAIKKRFGLCLSVFLFPSRERTQNFYRTYARKRFEARARVRERRNIKTNERVPGTFSFFTHKQYSILFACVVREKLLPFSQTTQELILGSFLPRARFFCPQIISVSSFQPYYCQQNLDLFKTVLDLFPSESVNNNFCHHREKE